MAEKIIQVDSLTQFKEDNVKYGIYVTRRRVTPEYRDGLKPVERKLIYSMFKDGFISNARKAKCAAITGNVIRLFHPHSKDAVYGTLVGLGSWFSTKYPLVNGHGSFGNFVGSPAAADRYTEANLSEFCMDCVIADLKDSKEVVDWIANYDNTTVEPEYLPVAVPLLLINKTFGIGFGSRIDIPSHNIADVIDATINLIHNPDAPVVLIPDHCMSCDITNTNWKAICNKGFGSYSVRGIIDIGTFTDKGKDTRFNGNPCLIMRSIPDLTFFQSIKDEISELIRKNVIVQIIESKDYSTDDKLEFVYILKKGTDPNYVKGVIYKHTSMSQNCRVNVEVLDGITPNRMSYKSYLQAFLEFRKSVKFRLYCNRVQQVQTRMHQLDTYIKVLESGEIDNIIDLIKKQNQIDDNYLVEYLVKKLSITDLQAKFVLGTDLRRLSKGYLNKYKEEFIDLKNKESSYFNIITNEDLILEEIEQELLFFKNKYGDKRKCKVISDSEANGIPEGEFKVLITENNFIKKLPLNEQLGFYKGDAPKIVIKGDNTKNIIIFDNMGRSFKLPINKIPFTDKRSNGIDIRVLSKYITSNITCVMYEPTILEFSKKLTKFYLVVVTKLGYIKKMDLEDFLTIPPSGIPYIKLDEGDSVIDTMIISGTTDVILYSDSKALRMSMNDIPHLKRSAKGSIGMKSPNGIDGMSIICGDTTDIVVITESGFVNRFSPAGLPQLGRGKSGSKVIQLNKSDIIKAIYGLNINDSIKIITQSDNSIINVSNIQDGSSVSKGNKVLSTRSDKIVKCSIIKNR